MDVHRAGFSPAGTPGLPNHGRAGVLERNIQALINKRKEREDAGKIEDGTARTIAAFAGSMNFVYLHVILYGIWVLNSLGWTLLPPFDPTLVKLATCASVEAIFLSTMVLITQNRMSSEADRRAELDLQISLLAEHEITGLIGLIALIAAKLDIEAAEDSELHDLKQDIVPEHVLDRIDQTQKHFDR